MQMRQVMCPICGTLLMVPPESAGRVARCGRCQGRFRLPRRISATEDIVASWLHQGKHLHDRDMDQDDMPQGELMDTGNAPAISGETAVLSAITDPIRIVQIAGQGVLFEFAASRLTETAFRCAMPRRCMQCGTRMHLAAHPIVFSPQLLDSVAMEGEHDVHPVSFNEQELESLQGEEMLNRLPENPNVPSPGNLPMPYWLCDMCSGAGMISAQIKINPKTKDGGCRLFMKNLRAAGEFCKAVGGESCREYAQLAQRVSQMVEQPWDSLSEAVQHRLQQWYKQVPQEQFLAYVPDRSRFRTEDGMYGIVITNRRMVVHVQARHREAKLNEPFEIRLAMTGPKGILEIKTPAWDVGRFTVDREGLNRLRRGVTMGGFKATWH